MELQAPLPLGHLPKSLDPEGKTLFSLVYGFSASKKAKRYEIVAAVDGEAVNLYDVKIALAQSLTVQSSRLITSYSVPPQSSFQCAPCSIRLRKARKSRPVRLTYCILQRLELQLLCFTEKGDGITRSEIAKSIFLLEGTHSPVVSLEAFPVSHTSRDNVPCDIIVVHQDGTIRRIAGDLSGQTSSMKLADHSKTPTSALTVTAAYWMSEEQTKGSLLKNRADLWLGLDDGGFGVLVVVGKRTLASGKGIVEMIYGLWPVEEQRFPTTFGSDTASPTTPLIVHTLPDTEIWKKSDRVQYSFNSVNGTLSVAFGHGLNTYDLSALTPEISSKLSLSNAASSYPMRLTSALAVGSTSSAVNLHDTKYRSIQSTVDLENVGSGLKRKKSGNVHHNAIRFITYFAKIRRLVACRGQALITIDIADSATPGQHRALSGNSMLVNSVGRGMQCQSSKAVKLTTPSFLEYAALPRFTHQDKANWASQQQRLDELAEKGDITAFDELMAKELCESSDGEVFEYERLGLPRSPLHVDQVKIDYLLSRIFEASSEIDGGMSKPADLGSGLKLGLQTPRLIHWLIQAGRLTDRHVERALRRKISSQTFLVRPGAVVLALTQDKTSHEMIIDYLRHASLLPLTDVLQAIKLLLEDVVAYATRILPPSFLHDDNGGHIMSISQEAGQVDEGEDVRSVQQLRLPLEPPSEGGTGYSSSSVALLIALEAVGSHLPRDLTAALCSQLSQSEILSIIQVLRQQLFYSGHTSYLPAPPTSAQLSPPLIGTRSGGASLNLDCILRLLSSCLDAVGPAGFLAQSETDAFLEKLIPDLKSEISFAFEGIQETNHLQGLLQEVLRYVTSTQESNNGRVSGEHLLLDRQQRPGTIVTLFTESKADEGDVEGQGGLLPLSLRAENVTSLVKVRKGGGQVSKRSRRDIRKLQDRRVGNYSFERLVL